VWIWDQSLYSQIIPNTKQANQNHVISRMVKLEMQKLDSKLKNIIDTAFLDTGGAADYAALNMCTTDTFTRKIYIRDTVFWKLSEADHVTFASIRNDVETPYDELLLWMVCQ